MQLDSVVGCDIDFGLKDCCSSPMLSVTAAKGKGQFSYCDHPVAGSM